MLFPDVSPSRDECIADVASALQDDHGRIYLDASVLIHCYEMSAPASEDLLGALERYGARVAVPAWAAKETWEYATSRINRRPLKPLADRLRRDLQRFQTETTRYIDDDTLRDLSKDEYQQELGTALDTAVTLIQRVADHQPRTDQTTARLLPFIDAHRLKSDLITVVEEVARTAPTRIAHRMPPGFADAPQEEVDDESRTPAVKGKGKAQNPHGDLIIWLEILADCSATNAEQLVLITRDTTKADWAFVPKKIRDERGRPQENGGLVTLPLPLLVHEATQRCQTLKRVHIVSVEMLAHVLRTMRVEVSHLAAALQAREDDDGQPPPPDIGGAYRSPDGRPYLAEFRSGDMAYDPQENNDLDQLILGLTGEGWKVQNQAARGLEPLLPGATRTQKIQIGRGLVAAANDGALEPAEFLEKLLAQDTLDIALRGDVLIGALAEVYLAETGEPKKPVATRTIATTLYRYERDAALQPAYQVVLERITAQSRKYLTLPLESRSPISLDLALERDVLRGISANGVPLLEEDAPPSRIIQRSGQDATMNTDELIELLSEEFVLPPDILATDSPRSASFTAPELLGFVTWGPQTGTLLR